MPAFTFTSPEGQKYTVNGPDGATQEQAFAMLQQHLGAGEPSQHAPSMSWGDVGRQALQNAPHSAMEFAKGVAQPFLHPIDTAQSLSNLGRGAIAMGGSALAASVPSETLPESTFGERYQHALKTVEDKSGASHAYPEALAKHFADRYGNVEGLKKAIAEDPVGVIGELSTALTAGGSAVARAPGLIGKAGQAARVAGDIANPLMGPAKAAGAAGEEAARLTRPIKAPTTDALYEAAEAAYENPAIKAIAIKPSAFRQWKDTLLATNDVVDEDLSPKTFNILKRLDSPPAGSFFDGRSIQSLRRKLGQAAGSADATERKAARDAIGSLDDFLANIPKGSVLRGDAKAVSAALEEARGNYAAAKRSDTIEGKLEAAELQAGSANSGMNLDNATRQRIKDILKSEKLRRGYSSEELAQMRKIVIGSRAENAARRVGNMLGGGGGMGSTVTGAIGASAGAALGHGPGAFIGAAVPATVGYALKKLSAAMSQADVRKLQELVRTRSPLGQQMQSSLNKFGKASAKAKNSPTPANIARFMLASKNLSSNLSDAGIDAQPDDIAGAFGQGE